MEDPNSIAWLSPTSRESESKYTWEAIRMNIPQDIHPHEETISDYRSRESTASLEDPESNTPEDAFYPKVHLVFNSGLKSGHGLMFGTDPNCDVILPRLRKISQRHCYLTFDAERRLILQDCSTHGTIVTYDGQGRELRRHFRWILGGHDVPRKTIKINQYNANVDRFLKEADEPHLNGLGIYSPTAPPSQSHTPNQGAIRIKKETLGKGAFAVVRRYWDVSSGMEYAYKEPLDRRRFDRKLWEKEIDIMRQISHDHVVKLEEWIFAPSPRLVLEYVPFGTLASFELSLEESMTVLCQGLSALTDLHGRKVPIVHRDIKPGNILVKSRDPLHIKLADFGLSRASNDLTTLCGTPLYLAPEVHKKESFTPAVDIWSLGVVVFECACGLPDSRGYRGRDWCEMLVDQVNDWENGDLIDLLSSVMIVMDPRLRRSAQDCYMEASRLTVASYERCRTPTPTSYGYKPVTSYAAEVQGVEDGNLHTLTNAENSFPPQNSTSSSQRSDVRYTRSGAPPPSSGAPTIIANSNCSPQRAKSVSGLDLFGEGWLQDPNCVGSSVAAMGQESLDFSSWDDLATDPSGGNVPHSIPAAVYEQNEN